ncbi:iron ABC transporter substrate-binding protein [Clostridium botulinum]|uniref:Iron ABC transporter substrate-binding protein n=1 Tax=Clostridium botulinum TaxID=1491 RepID=A0A846JSM0_CLOBO|nr:ABC transporter substrate-binding protein [Clostridium botulinum]KAI3347320.1 ABC transporter substrate-binding protein [Clostridium botulinum]KOM86766.1 iron ABC transporter substrate-binding protein [Clostridium botulinum]KOR60035.1 iron ABC transporter substrate-binding protein [Clostridium botulinum]MCS6109378.1 iron ABC transporter substrate-binding protein [Clostridium botulinum]NFE12349.1 iron ABC transporter substrate-binding protein [Clostridium botulinum]
MNNNLKKFIATLTITILVVGAVGCANNNKKHKVEKSSTEANQSNFETVKFVYSDGAKDYDVTVKSPRQKAVTLSQFMTEMLLALGLENKMIGTALLDNPILPEFEEAYNKIPVLKIGEGHSVSKEAFIATGADFVSGWDSSISEQTTGAPEELISKDITPFMAKSYRADSTVETVYEDFELLGKIFGVQDNAKEVIDKMKSDIKIVTDKVGDIKQEDRVKMMVYDSVENDAMVVGSGLANNLIELAGGNNVFAKNAKKPYINVSWESIVAENPEVILITDFMAGEPVQEKIDFLKTHPALKDVSAIKNNKIYVVGLADLSPGIRNPKLIEQMYGYFFGENK